MDAPELERLLDEATVGLADDPELRLDVRRELRAHIEDGLGEADGATEAERLQQALAALGPVTELAGALAEGNRRRMRLRGLTRMLLRRLVVPAAVVMALVLVSRDLVRFHGLSGVYVGGGGDFYVPPDKLFDGLSEEQVFLFTGDPSRTGRAAQQRAIWEHWPDDPVYYGNYITSLLAESDAPGSVERVAAELAAAETVDPGNARYAYALAAVLFEAGSNWENVGEGDAQSRELVVTDPALLDRALEVLRSARAMPRYRRYIQEMNRKRLGQLPPPRDLVESNARVAYCASILLPDLQKNRNLTRAIPVYAERLAGEGRIDEAVELLGTWEDLVPKLNDDVFVLIDNLVVAALIRDAGKEVAGTLDRLGRSDAATRTRAMAGRLSAPFDAWDARRKGPGTEAFEQTMEQRGGFLANLLLPAIGEEIEVETLSEGRRLDFILAERALMVGLNLVFLVLMIACAVVWARWRRAPGADSAPLLLMPRLAGSFWIFGAGAVLPVIGYYVYSRIPGLSGRSFALSYLPYRFLAEFLLLGSLVLFLSGTIASRFVRRRCIELGLAVPPRRRAVEWVFGIAVAVGWAACLMVREATRYRLQPVALAIAGLVTAGLLLGLAAVFFRRVLGRPEYGLYYGTWGRTLVPVYAAAILLLGLLSHPYLAHTETRLVRQDPLIGLDPEGGFTLIETRLVKRLQTQVEEAAAASDFGMQAHPEIRR